MNPTLCKLDFFCNVEWELLFSAAKLLPLASSISDHCPLLLRNDAVLNSNRRLRFESYWLFVNGFKDLVAQS